jgi:lipopolysaccharide/colanic/teichoic acid biosynthesis glycosyltransferase
VFGAKAGITGAAALAYRDEESVLAAEAARLAREDGRAEPTAADVDRAYRETVLPAKLALEVAYLDHRSVRGDLDLLGRTIGQVLVRTTRR